MRSQKLKRNFWETSEIECMLSLIKEVQTVQGTTATTHYTFVQIANRMRKRGFPNKSPTQIRRKWFQMKSAYLCFKRGNVERLLLIPERFRSVIAQFVENECKSGKCVTNNGPDNVVVVPDAVKERIHKSAENNSYYHNKFAKFVTRMRNTHKMITDEFATMQESLMLYEQKCQSIRDNNMITFIKNN